MIDLDSQWQMTAANTQTRPTEVYLWQVCRGVPMRGKIISLQNHLVYYEIPEQFNQSDIASNIAALTLTLSINGC